MRIALVTPGFSASESDWCIPALLDLVRKLAERHDVRVYALRYPHRTGAYRVYGADVFAFGGAVARGMSRVSLLFNAYRRIVADARASGFDVIHAFWADEAGQIATRAAKAAGIPSVVSIMGGELVGLRRIGYGGQLNLVSRLMISGSLAAADAVTVGSHFLELLAAPRLKSPPVVAPLGVDTAMFRPTSPPKSAGDSYSILMAGSLVPVKGHEVALRALARIVPHDLPWRLGIVGDGPLKERLSDLVHELSLEGRVNFWPAVAHHDLPRLYPAADLLLVASHFESQCLVALEAAACGVPVAGTRVGVVPELAPDDAVEPDNVAELDALLARKIAEGVRPREGSLLDARFHLENTVERLLRLYEDRATG